MKATLTTVTTLAVVATASLSASSAQPPSLPTAPAPPPPQPSHTVTVKVSGPKGSVFLVSGEVFGHTGLIDMPESGVDSASFTTSDTGNLSLSVSVLAGANPRTCAIELDGAAMVTETAAGEDTVTCTIRSV